MTQKRRRLLLWLGGALGAALLVLAAGAFLVAATGAYNVAASAGHLKITDWFLAFGMRRSVAVRADMIPPAPPLDDDNMVRLGAAHFHGGCAFCHGAPGIAVSPIAKQMLPSPPSLNDAAAHWDDRELFWIVKHGIKYTGMPGWPALSRDDEIWTLVAFLKRLPRLDTDAYRELAMGNVTVSPRSGREVATEEDATDAVSACARCHGAGERGPQSNLVPSLHGQSADYIVAALQAYASGRRGSGIMQPAAAALERDSFGKVAAYYARLRPPRGSEAARDDAGAIARGRIIATEGVPEERIPACTSCHGTQALPTYPRLAGLHAAYLVNQLRLWRSGVVPRTDNAAIMAPIARLLSDRQIDDVSAYWAAAPAEAHGQ